MLDFDRQGFMNKEVIIYILFLIENRELLETMQHISGQSDGTLLILTSDLSINHYILNQGYRRFQVGIG